MDHLKSKAQVFSGVNGQVFRGNKPSIEGNSFHYPSTGPFTKKKALPEKSLKLLFFLVELRGLEPLAS